VERIGQLRAKHLAGEACSAKSELNAAREEVTELRACAQVMREHQDWVASQEQALTRAKLLWENGGRERTAREEKHAATVEAIGALESQLDRMRQEIEDTNVLHYLAELHIAIPEKEDELEAVLEELAVCR